MHVWRLLQALVAVLIMDWNKEFFACLALRHTPGLGPRTWKTVLNAYDSAYVALRDVAHWRERRLARRDQVEAVRREAWREEAEAEYRAARSRGMCALSWHDPLFPQRLREIPDPPALLYVSGDASLLAGPCIGVVGARKCTRHGLDAAARISAELSRMGLSIVSGLALGVDREAHLGGLDGVGSSVAVLGCGLDVHYPKGNDDLRAALEQRGCVVSEFAPGIRPDANNFPYRNRIISGLSMTVVVAEAAKRSGSLITARLAAEQGREVFALPGPAGQAAFTGCHSLIRDGAMLADSAEDVLRELRFQFQDELAGVPSGAPASKTMPGGTEGGSADVTASPCVPLCAEHTAGTREPARPGAVDVAPAGVVPPDPSTEPDAYALWQALGEGRCHIDELTRLLGWESARVSQALLLMELSGYVRQWPGMRYSRVAR